MIYHVAKNGSDQNLGTEQLPFLTINKAASVAMAGDTVIVHEGEYREWVKPRHKGLSEKRRITYQAAEGEKVIIKGSERIQSWQNVEGNVWKVVLPNSFFGDYNPYTLEIFGDWLVTRTKRHLGDVYLNGMSFYEVNSYEELIDPPVRKETRDGWTWRVVPIKSTDQTKYVWYTEVAPENTTIWANFQGADPNEELVEINVRRSCFHPDEIGIDYITVRGFEMAHAATPWTPPTADQPGLIGPYWSKGWIIEHNIIHDSKCSAISLGKEASTGHNYKSIRKDKAGYRYQLEAVFSAKRIGWAKENIGSHIVRYNKIYDCGQNGVVGHLGCVFSDIHHNHIYNIGIKREFYGHEIGGIKLHAALDTQIHHNRVHDCTLGIWCDWQAQGTRISKNVLYNNNRDVYVEVSHGPYVVDNNIMASDYSFDNYSQGGAFINNLFCGKIEHHTVLDRATQYHLPHSTEVKGFSLIYGGDDRFFNNIFVGLEGQQSGTAFYNDYTTSFEKYIDKICEKHGDHDRYALIKQPVYINNNAYFNGARPFTNEEDNLIENKFDPKAQIIDNGDEVYLSIELPESFEKMKGQIHSTDTLTRVVIVDAEFENPDGSKLVLDTDMLDEKRSENCTLGPIAQLKKGKNNIRVW